MIKPCDWSIMTIEDINYNRNHLLKERLMNTSDHFYFRKPNTKLVHIRQVFTQFLSFIFLHNKYTVQLHRHLEKIGVVPQIYNLDSSFKIQPR